MPNLGLTAYHQLLLIYYTFFPSFLPSLGPWRELPKQVGNFEVIVSYVWGIQSESVPKSRIEKGKTAGFVPVYTWQMSPIRESKARRNDTSSAHPTTLSMQSSRKNGRTIPRTYGIWGGLRRPSSPIMYSHSLHSHVRPWRSLMPITNSRRPRSNSRKSAQV